MKTLCSIAVVGLVLLLLAVACAETEQDGNQLLVACRDGIRSYDAGGRDVRTVYSAYCAGFVSGMIDMHAAYVNQSGSSLRPLFCLPRQGIRVIQTERIVLHYLEIHPERLHLTQGDLFIEAIRDAFPCTPAASGPQR